MCVLAIAFQLDPRWPLVLAGNRDERHDRAAAPLHRWPGDPAVLAGRDLVGGGTWLGVSEAGRLATVTNVRAPDRFAEGRPSRGRLVRDLLRREGEYADIAVPDLADFNPMNLVLFSEDRLGLWSNDPAPERRSIGPGLYGLANGPLDEPVARVTRLKAGLARWLADGAGPSDDLFRLLADRETEPGDPRPIFLSNPLYGTRCSTVVRIGADGRGEILERRFDAQGEPAGESALTFAWDPSLLAQP